MKNLFCWCGEISKRLSRLDVQAVYRRRDLAGEAPEVGIGARTDAARSHANRNLSVRGGCKPAIVVILRDALGRQGERQLDLKAS
jgi:hypothetical protein